MPFEAIAGTPAGVMVLRTMKAERAGQLTADPVWDEALLSRLPRELFELLLRYMVSADVDPAAFKDRFQLFRDSAFQSFSFSAFQFFLSVVAKAVTATTRLKDLQRASLTCDTLEEFTADL